MSVRNTAPNSITETELQKDAAEKFIQNSGKTVNSESEEIETEDEKQIVKAYFFVCGNITGRCFVFYNAGTEG